MLLYITEALKRSGLSRGGLAKALGVSGSAITELLKGKRAIKLDELPQIIAYLRLDQVPIVGRIVHGGSIEPVDSDACVRIPRGASVLPPTDDCGVLQAYEVTGDGMMPRYDSGDAVVVWSSPPRQPVAHFIGSEAVVRADGKRWLRYLRRGRRPRTVDLTSFNAQPVEDVHIEWVAEVYLTMRGAVGQKRKRS